MSLRLYVRFFNVYTHESRKAEYAGEGFCVKAFLFAFLFATCKGLWLFSCIVFLASSVAYALYAAKVLSFPFYFIAGLVIKLYAGYSYSDWLHRKLIRKKYVLADVVLANNVMHAKLKFMKRQNASNCSAADAPRSTGS
ncbi:hypothetical protein APHCRT_0096 [Anaplasma phagocytophilum str. CRT53-1]|uniref:DUF2628 domain-containing protein n=1 Tax=Anaplasma phagocytophilum str. CRT53-1 TaxID=1359157 RepID=A0A0F3Q8R7_ANAPH|nr:hypothetical protein [Anaplasma phagocytophilum]KJV88556.1 hypothetical protein APHCRT_0096 [Anaplasma phagocytophilum str. CRT53-1]